MKNELRKDVISLEDTLVEFRCGQNDIPGSEADARKALLGWREDQPARSKCAHCGESIRVQSIVLAHQPSLWGKEHAWEVSSVVPERSRILKTLQRMDVWI